MITRIGKELEHLSTKSQGSINEEEINKTKNTSASFVTNKSYLQNKFIDGDASHITKSKKWTLKENSELIDGLIQYGNNITILKDVIPTRTINQILHHVKSVLLKIITNLHCLEANESQKNELVNQKTVKQILIELSRNTEKMKNRIIKTSENIAKDILNIISVFRKINNSQIEKIFSKCNKIKLDFSNDSSKVEPVNIIKITDGNITESDLESENEDHDFKKISLINNNINQHKPKPRPEIMKHIREDEFISRKRERDFTNLNEKQLNMSKQEVLIKEDCNNKIENVTILEKEKENMELLSSFFSNPLFFIPPHHQNKLMNKPMVKIGREHFSNNKASIMVNNQQIKGDNDIPIKIECELKSNAFNVSFEEQFSFNKQDRNDHESKFCCYNFDNFDNESSEPDYNNLY